MQKRMLYVLSLLIISFLGSSIVLGGDAGICPAPSAKDQTVLDSPTEPVIIPAGKGSVPRNQVLLEIVTATW
ncbi:MAG: hypothetical protein ACE5KJ_00100 [Candidatus Zixiibacteriota bacterium]